MKDGQDKEQVIEIDCGSDECNTPNNNINHKEVSATVKRAGDQHHAEESTSSRDVKTSATLSKFAQRLLVPRGPVQIDVPELIPLNDYILEGFGKEYKRGAVDLNESEGEAEEDGEVKEARFTSPGATKAESDDGAEDADEHLPSDYRIIRVGNVWYGTKEDTLRKLFEKFGQLERLEMLTDRDTKRFRGVVVVEYSKAGPASLALTTLNGMSIDNRNIRIEPQERLKTMKMESRYFLADKTIFCRRCHGIGHTRAFCPNPSKVTPCPSCAGVDGHNLHDCPERGGERPAGLLCIECGASDHTMDICPHKGPTASDLQKEVSIRCMHCASSGHPCCASSVEPWKPGLGRVFCSRCAMEGHFGYSCQMRQLPGEISRRHTIGGGTHIRFNSHAGVDDMDTSPDFSIATSSHMLYANPVADAAPSLPAYPVAPAGPPLPSGPYNRSPQFNTAAIANHAYPPGLMAAPYSSSTPYRSPACNVLPYTPSPGMAYAQPTHIGPSLRRQSNMY